MENTKNLGLKKWEGGDRILHSEFNDNWDKIDTALTAHAAKLAGCGNCKIEYGTYRGTGTTEHSLTFSAKPMAVFIQADIMGDFGMILRGSKMFLTYSNNTFACAQFNWTETGVTISRYTTSDTASTVLNEGGQTYTYMALLPMGE